MTHTHLHDERRRQAVGWALHALEPDEHAEFALHLADCADCRATVDEDLETLGELGRTVEQEDPPARLRRNILARASEEMSNEAAGPRAPAPARPARADGTPGPGVPPLRRGRRTVRLLAAAAAVVVVGAVGGLVAVNQSLREERDAQAAAAAESQEVLQVVRDAGTPGARRATLTTPSGQLVGLVVDVGRGPELLTTGLPGNRQDQTYVLWGLTGSRPVALGAFDVPGSGASARSVPSPGEAGRYAGYAVSLEPGHTVPASPTEVVASGQVGR